MLHQVCLLILIFQLLNNLEKYLLISSILQTVMNCQYFYSADLRRPTSCSMDDGI